MRSKNTVFAPQCLTIYVLKFEPVQFTTRVANRVDPDETPHSAASHLSLNCLLWPVCPNTSGKYGKRTNIVGNYS